MCDKERHHSKREYLAVFRLSRIKRCIKMCAVLQENRVKCCCFFLNKMTPASVMKRFKANGASLMSDFRRASPKLACLRQCHITNESTETINCY